MSVGFASQRALAGSSRRPSAPERELRRFLARTANCRVCPTLKPHRKFPAGSHGTARFGLMIVGEAPGKVSLDNGKPFSNPRNLTVRRAFARAIAPLKLELEDLFYLTDVVKCWPAAAPASVNRSPLAVELKTCSELHLGRELELVRPRLVLAFGRLAAGAILRRPLKLKQMHGKRFDLPGGVRVIPLMHPSSVNLAGIRSIGAGSLPQYEAQLAALIESELRTSVRNGELNHRNLLRRFGS